LFSDSRADSIFYSPGYQSGVTDLAPYQTNKIIFFRITVKSRNENTARNSRPRILSSTSGYGRSGGN
jgi:hypothetical protein